MTVLLPIAVVVTRYKCPACSRSYANKSGAIRHIARCWYNPDAKGCKTCDHYTPAGRGGGLGYWPGEEESCSLDEGVLLGSDDCPTCRGAGKAYVNDFEPPIRCDSCLGTGGTNGPVRKPGPIVHCELWKAKSNDG